MRDTSWTIERLDTVQSTNDHLKWAARREAVDRTVVVAKRQTGGRGRGRNTWTSPPGGLYCSLLLREVPVALRPLLAFVAGEALSRTLDTFGVKLRHWLKWPNDLLIAPPGDDTPAGKAGGTLVETVSRGDELDFAIIGVGVNLTTAESDLPGGQDPPAVALRSFEERVPDVELFLDVFLSRVEEVLRRFGAAPGVLVQAVERRLAWRGDAVRAALTNGDTVAGVLAGLTPSGGLRLQTDEGERVLDAWDVASLDRAS